MDDVLLTELRHKEQIPAGLIVTGPNIASQELLFGQLATHLRSATDNIVVTLRSGDAPNLKTVLKKVIRDAASSKPDPDDDGQILSQKDVCSPSGCTVVYH